MIQESLCFIKGLFSLCGFKFLGLSSILGSVTSINFNYIFLSISIYSFEIISHISCLLAFQPRSIKRIHPSGFTSLCIQSRAHEIWNSNGSLLYVVFNRRQPMFICIRLRKRQQRCEPKIGGETKVTHKLSSELSMDQFQYKAMCERSIMKYCSHGLVPSSFGMGMASF